MQDGTIRELFHESARGDITLLKITPNDYESATISLLKNAADGDIPVIYIGVKRPYVHLRKLLNDNHIMEDHVYVVDTITKTITDEGIVEQEHVEYMDSPQTLTNVATAVSVMAEKIDAPNAILLIDSLETLMTYNTAHTVSRFLDDLNGRTETLELSMAIFKTEETLEEQLAEALLDRRRDQDRQR
jgi:archaellum biogenesis ATPase FlaH